MKHQQNTPVQDTNQPSAVSRSERFGEWIQDPMGGVIAASVATIGSFGVVLSGMWAINLALN
jgi:hypothetical protein